MDQKKIEWVLKIGVAGEFLGHGIFATGFPKIAGLEFLSVSQKSQWVGWIGEILGTDPATSAILLTLVGAMDILIAILVLVKPIRIALLWATFWGFWTALVRPLVGEPIWDFIERWANWSAPLALLMLLGWPKTFKEWLK